MQVTPAAKTVIVVEPKQQTTSSGISIPISANEKSRPEVGEVVAIGKGEKPVSFKIGDVIVYRKYMDNRVFIRDSEFNFVDFKDITGVITKKAWSYNGKETTV